MEHMLLVHLMTKIYSYALSFRKSNFVSQLQGFLQFSPPCALYDAKYYFYLVDTGQHGSNNDSSILNYSEIEINLLPAKNLKSCSFELLPSDMIEDEICLLKAWLMHAHPDRLAEEQLVFCY